MNIAIRLAALLFAFACSWAHAGAVISSGAATIGVNNEGDLIFQGVGLRYVPTGGEALAPGCPCEGWGIADVVSRSFGKAGRNFGIQNIVVESFTSTASTARSVVRVRNGLTPVFRVTHDFRVSPQTANLFEAIVTVENIFTATVDVRYRRAMDWDVPPTTFSELVTIVTNGAQDVVFSSDNGFADGNPLNAAGQILFTGQATNSGPADHGAVFDFNLGTLAPGKTRTFSIFYGAAGNEPAAMQVLAAIGPEVYSLGKPNTPSLSPPGSPNTFIFAFKGVGGTPAILREADLAIGGLDLVDNGTGQPLTLKARLGNAGGKEAKTFKVTFYDGDPTKPGFTTIATRDIATLGSEDFIDIAIEGIASVSGRDLFAVADPERKLIECSLTNNVVSIPARPRVVVGRIVAAADRAVYGPSTGATFSGAIHNPGRFPYEYSARLRVEDSTGAAVAQFAARSVGSVAAGADAAVAEAWNTGTVAAGNYRLVADLFDLAGNRIDSSTASFAIETGVAGDAIEAKITTDKAIYSSLETVQVSGRIGNRTANLAVDGLSAVTTIVRADATTLFSASAAIGALAAGGEKMLPYAVPIANGVAGPYRATLVVVDASGAERARSEATFTVQSSAQTGAGLRGELTASPKEIPQGDPVVLVGAARNEGNADLTGLPLKLQLADGETGVLLHELTYTANLARLGRFDIAASWNTGPARVGATVVAVLSAQVDTRTVLLAQDTFTVLAPPIKLDVTQARAAKGRVLALLSCQVNRGAEANDDDGTDRGAANRDAACLADRVAFVRAYLDDLGVTHRITTDRDEFRTLFRSGAYNVFWISGGGNKLHAPLADEVREAVNRGDALVLDGVHDNRNYALDEVAGIKHVGKLNPLDQPVAMTGSLFDAMTLASSGRPLRAELDGGVEQARFAGTAHPAIVSRDFGLGRGLLFSFDLVATLQKSIADGGQSAESWKSQMAKAFGYAVPALVASYTAGGYADLRTLVKNLARPVEVEVILAPPAGAVVAATEPAAVMGTEGTATWRFTLPVDATRALDAQLRLPAASGSYTATTTVNTIRDTGAVLYTTLTTSMEVAAMLPQAGAVLASLRAVALQDSKDQLARDKAVMEIGKALDDLAQSRHDTAIAQLIDAVADLESITGRDMGGYILQVDLMIKEIGRRWFEAQP